MSAPRPTKEPSEIIAGDSITWEKSFTNYHADDGWMLTYILRSKDDRIDIGGAQITTAGQTFVIAVPGATTKDWEQGEYSYNAYVALAPDRFTVAFGTISIWPNFDTVGSFDPRSESRINLDNIRAVIAGRATSDALEYTIGGRQLKKMMPADLLKLEQVFAWRVGRENGTAPKFAGARFHKDDPRIMVPLIKEKIENNNM